MTSEATVQPPKKTTAANHEQPTNMVNVGQVDPQDKPVPQTKKQPVEEYSIDLDSAEEEQGQAVGRRRQKDKHEEWGFNAPAPRTTSAEIQLAPAHVEKPNQPTQIPQRKPAVPEPKEELIDQLMESADKQTHILFIPHFSDVGRINEQQAQQILEQVEEELKDQMVDRQSAASEKHDVNAFKNSNVTTKDEFTPRDLKINNKLLETKPPEQEKLPPKQKPCCTVM